MKKKKKKKVRTTHKKARALPIKNWAEDDRPREKLVLKGRHALSDAELIAILIRSGTKEGSAVELSKKILSAFGNSLNELAKASVKDLVTFKGMGEAKALSIIAALELGRRRKAADKDKEEKIITSRHAYELFKPVFLDLPHEEFWILVLSRSNNVIRKERVSAGGVAGTVVDPKIIFKTALAHLGSGIVLAHNHPSGNLKPSEQDIRLTRNIREAGNLLEISVIDHLIVSNEGYYSFADEGLL
ncbi:MAG: DNA repair protein RadC [Bacteroidota bacterium]